MSARKDTTLEDTGLSYDEVCLARRWAVFNCWGWPSDLPMPEDHGERKSAAQAQMRKIERAIGIRRCLLYWNTTEWREQAVKVKQAYR